MGKKYVYRKHLRKPSIIIGSVMGFFILVYSCLAFAVLSSLENKFDKTAVIIFVSIGVFMLILISLENLILYFALFRRFKRISVELTDDSIIYNNLKGTTIIPYSDITNVRFPSIRYLGGWVKIIYGKKNIKLTVVLENIGDLITELREKLNELNKQDVYNKHRMFKFYKTSKYSDASWKRIYRYFKKMMIFIVCNFFVGFGIASLTHKDSAKFGLGFAGFMLPLLAYLICEIILARKVSKQSDEASFYVPESDEGFERKVFRNGSIIYSIIYLILAFLVVR